MRMLEAIKEKDIGLIKEIYKSGQCGIDDGALMFRAIESRSLDIVRALVELGVYWSEYHLLECVGLGLDEICLYLISVDEAEMAA
jgi:hypothetical protein